MVIIAAVYADLWREIAGQWIKSDNWTTDAPQKKSAKQGGTGMKKAR